MCKARFLSILGIAHSPYCSSAEFRPILRESMFVSCPPLWQKITRTNLDVRLVKQARVVRKFFVGFHQHGRIPVLKIHLIFRASQQDNFQQHFGSKHRVPSPRFGELIGIYSVAEGSKELAVATLHAIVGS